MTPLGCVHSMQHIHTHLDAHRQKGTGISFQIDALPDTGASKTLLSWDIIQAHNLSVHKSNATTVFAANNTEMILHGTVYIVITCHGVDMNIEAIATEGVTETMLICHLDLVKMRLLNPIVPRELCNSMQDDPLNGPMQKLLEEFSDIFNNRDEVLKPMTGPPMHIHLKKGPLTSTRALTAMESPLYNYGHPLYSVREQIEK